LHDAVVARDVVRYGDCHLPSILVVFARLVFAKEEHVISAFVKFAIRRDRAWVDNTPLRIRRQVEATVPSMVGLDIECKFSLLSLSKRGCNGTTRSRLTARSWIVFPSSSSFPWLGLQHQAVSRHSSHQAERSRKPHTGVHAVMSIN
jgi:hypothetical protein